MENKPDYERVHVEWWSQQGFTTDGRPYTNPGIMPYIDLDFRGEELSPRLRDITYRLWERSAEHSKLVIILNLMTPSHDEGGYCRWYELTAEEVWTILGWENGVPGKDADSTGDHRGFVINIGKQWTSPIDSGDGFVHPDDLLGG